MPRSARPRKKKTVGRRVVPSKARKGARIFAPIRRIMQQLAAGEIDSIRGVPVFIDWDGEWREVVPTLAFWRNLWERIARHEGVAVDFSPVDRLIRALHYGVPMTPEMIERANEALETCEELFRKASLRDMADMVLTEQIALEEAVLQEGVYQDRLVKSA